MQNNLNIEIYNIVCAALNYNFQNLLKCYQFKQSWWVIK